MADTAIRMLAIFRTARSDITTYATPNAKVAIANENAHIPEDTFVPSNVTPSTCHHALRTPTMPSTPATAHAIPS